MNNTAVAALVSLPMREANSVSIIVNGFSIISFSFARRGGIRESDPVSYEWTLTTACDTESIRGSNTTDTANGSHFVYFLREVRIIWMKVNVNLLIRR